MTNEESKQCFFESGEARPIDYKDVETLRRFLSAGMKIRPRRKTGLCALHQRKVSRAIKQARIAGLVSFVTK